MPLDPFIKKLIAKAYLNGFDHIHHLSPEQMRFYLSPPRLKVQKADFQDFKTTQGLTLRCYTPATLKAVSPVIIYLCANAFVIDRLDPNNDYCSLLANTLNMKVISVAHRLAPEYKFPRFLYDCLESIEWIYQHAEKLAIHPEKIALWGESSGASIAAASTQVLRDSKRSLIKHQTLFYPMVDLVSDFPSKKRYGQGFMLDKTFIQWLDARGFEPEQDRAHPLASPLRASNFVGLPSATIITAQYDPLRDEGEAYGQKLQAAGVPLKIKRFNGMIHGFMRFYNKVESAHQALLFASESLKSHFALSATGCGIDHNR